MSENKNKEIDNKQKSTKQTKQTEPTKEVILKLPHNTDVVNVSWTTCEVVDKDDNTKDVNYVHNQKFIKIKNDDILIVADLTEKGDDE